MSQQPRCSCCGGFLGPEHVLTQETNQEIRKALVLLKQARETHNWYLGAKAVSLLEGLAELPSREKQL